jgi:uncharacterized membrane protein YdbT with pleckstrin-like domain
VAINPKLLNDGESIVVSTRTHAKALILPMVSGLLILAAAAFSETTFVSGSASTGLWVVVVLLLAWFVLRPFLEWMTASYTITDRRLITRNGILTRRGHDIPLVRISDVAYEMGLLDRMLGCGTLIVSDASTHGRVLLHDIPQVEDTQRRLNVLLHETHSDEGA